jgi:transposase
LAYFILDIVGELDLSEIEDVLQAKDPRGEKSYDPRMMVALLLYAYCVGVFSSRRIVRATFEDVAMRFISGDQHPHFTRVAAFRRDHLEAFGGLFVQVVQLCEKAGLVKLGHVAIDGTKVRANASKHKAMSYDRMKKEGTKLEKEITELLARAEAVDAAEDEQFGDSDGMDIPEELKRRETRLARIRKAKAELEAEARAARASHLRDLADVNEHRATSAPTQKRRRAAATTAMKQRREADRLKPDNDDDEPPDAPSLPFHRPKTTTTGEPKPKAQRNFTDPDSRIMVEGSGAFAQAYNAQAAVTEETQIIVACPLSNQAPDNEYLPFVLAELDEVLGRSPDRVTADNGYWSAASAAWCEDNEIDAYISTGRKCRAPPDQQSVPTTSKERMTAKLQTTDGRDMYRRRKFTVEPVFGQIKEARGFRRFFLRGLRNVRLEWQMICATHNLLKLFRAAAA